jgi:hypothetical protein
MWNLKQNIVTQISSDAKNTEYHDITAIKKYSSNKTERMIMDIKCCAHR